MSRLHAYLRHDGTAWVVADAGSKNGAWLDGRRLEARREQVVRSKATVRIGDIELTFYTVLDLYALLGGV
ncbi:MAG: FHA domain-containing protein [Proteobacteria bacterium]|nr:FHA domain-containing protein [Pseudomonadota bacterium]